MGICSSSAFGGCAATLWALREPAAKPRHMTRGPARKMAVAKLGAVAARWRRIMTQLHEGGARGRVQRVQLKEARRTPPRAPSAGGRHGKALTAPAATVAQRLEHLDAGPLPQILHIVRHPSAGSQETAVEDAGLETGVANAAHMTEACDALLHSAWTLRPPKLRQRRGGTQGPHTAAANHRCPRAGRPAPRKAPATLRAGRIDSPAAELDQG
mmetsp:Transcript_49581/g.106129  ORF Transcript_49581/g.106129 Transcript_49581/m.106129 type:complete len:213 (-) Transcript_49581:1040-1678(-)